MHVLFVVATCVLLVVSKCFGQDRSVDVYAFYLKEKCGGVPNRVDSGNFQGECVEVCGSFTSVWKSINAACNNSESSIDYKEIVAGFFGGASYLLVEKFDSDCETLSSSSALVASNSCEQVVWYMPEWGHGLYEIIHLEHNGSVSLRYYLDDQCSNPSNGSWDLSKDIPPKNADVGADLLNSSTCDENGLRWTYYGSANAASSSSSSNSSGHSGDKRQSISSASGTSDPSLSVATESQEGKGQIVAVTEQQISGNIGW
ncbi:hypothetical protein PHYPSEUDO_003965 [Phytophthora pseudosyringae]|uniref:Uncharacterized protein n=1 Tax=Phytophthora pseudosyringae TaxID=221518 RepID=A0A8T1VSI8_9STRA|nr:hypothetical protein PHYPSEUDO_003965 [Phytophthora pseudosyringae]